MPRYIPIGKVSDIPALSARCIEVEGRRIAVFNLDGGFYAIDDECTHEGGPLSEGCLHGEEVECPWHGARFNIKSGRVTLDPADSDVASYALRVTGDTIEIEI